MLCNNTISDAYNLCTERLGDLRCSCRLSPRSFRGFWSSALEGHIKRPEEAACVTSGRITIETGSNSLASLLRALETPLGVVVDTGAFLLDTQGFAFSFCTLSQLYFHCCFLSSTAHIRLFSSPHWNSSRVEAKQSCYELHFVPRGFPGFLRSC